MNFTDQTFERLAAFESYFDTAIHGDWCPNPGRDALNVMCDALDEHDGRKNPRNFNCASCQLRIVKRTGYLYIADKAEREAAAAREAEKRTETPSKPKTPAKPKKK